MRVSQIKKALGYFVKERVTPLLWGTHGIGKTETVCQWGKENDHKVIILNLATMEIGDFLGVMKDNSSSKKADYWLPSWFPTDPNSKGIIFLDEVNRARRDVLQGVFSLLSEGRIHQEYLPAGWSCIAAANYGEDYIVTDIEDHAFMSRFCHVPVHFDAEEWTEYAKTQGVESNVLSFVKENGKYFSKGNAFSYDKVVPGVRNMTWVNKLLSNTEMEPWLVSEIVYGLLGTAAGNHFLKHREEYQKYIKGADVLNKFNKVKGHIEKVVADNKRLDMLVTTSDELYTEIETLTKGGVKSLTPKQADNVAGYMTTVPRDNGFGLLKRLMDNEHVQTSFGDRQDLYDHFLEYGKAAKAAREAEEKAKDKQTA